MSKIKVGMIRSDLHARYYGALMDKHDPLLLREPELGLGGYFYFYTWYNAPLKIMVPTVTGFQITKLWDREKTRAENMRKIFYGKPRVCDTFEEVSDDVDLVFIADCDGDGSDHLELATPGLKKRVPTFVDKPFAYEVKDARVLVRLAKECDTPMMSLSMLRVLPHATRFRKRFDELDGPEFGTIKGGGEKMAGHIHTISLAQHLFGAGVESVECMGKTPLAYIHLDYGGKPNRPGSGVVLSCAAGSTYHASFYASAYSRRGVIHSPNMGDFEFPYAAAEVLKMIKKMVRTGKSPVPYEEMVECIAIATAARLSQKMRKRVYLKDLK